MLIKNRFGRMASETDVLPDLDQDLLKKLCPPYKVILHNCDCHSADYVEVALIKAIPALTEDEAFDIMITAHTEGTAVVVIVPQETAEFYQERIQSFNLGCTIEPDE